VKKGNLEYKGQTKALASPFGKKTKNSFNSLSKFRSFFFVIKVEVIRERNDLKRFINKNMGTDIRAVKVLEVKKINPSLIFS